MAHIVVTRPQGKGEELVARLEKQGHKTSLCPVLRIDYLATPEQQLATLNEADIAVFVSQDAVYGLHKLLPKLANNIKFFAVGDTTAQTIKSLFNTKAIVPKQQDSEGLVALAQLQQVESKNVVLVKGRGGRTVIAKTLKQRGAFVNAVAVYERVALLPDSEQWLSEWHANDVDALVVTSNSAIDAIFNCQNNQLLEWLKSRHFYIVSDRTRGHLESLGVDKDNITVAAGASNEAIAVSINCEQETSMSEQPEQASVSANDSETAVEKPVVTTQASPSQPNAPQKISKVGLLALLVALGVGAGTGYLYWQKYLQDQNAAQQESAAIAQIQELQSANQALQEQLATLNAAQQRQQQQSQQWQQQFDDEITRQLSANQRSMIAHVEQSIAASKDNSQPPLDMNEVRRLVSLADFKIWSENNYSGAASVLQRLDALLASYAGNAQLRRAIHTDLQMLASVEVADVEAIVLTLHGLGNQVDKLSFNMVDLPDDVEPSTDDALSADVSDWRANLGRTWDQLVDDFIKVRKRQAAIEPLLDDEQQRLIKQRIHFNLDQAGFAATHQYVDLYQQALQSASDLITRYYDLSDTQTAQFLSQLKQLQLKPLTPSQPISLATVTALEES
ncbi:uroporphyrinogen-III synthase [Pseudoalteromonas pernae]|uniref:uroporphyrinogen-III synthase n=1 Tax=Pseudoalteromonas pernae TaxID=3118054 RepID=UPI0032428380